MIQHPLPPTCKFYVESYPLSLDTASHLQILCYTNHNKERPINYKIDWRRRIAGLFLPVTNVQGNTYICTASDLGANIIAEVTSLDTVYGGSTVLEFGPVMSPLPTGSLSMPIASITQSVESGQPINQLIAQGFMKSIPSQKMPQVNNHTVFLLGNDAQRQCDLKFTEHGMRIKDLLTDYCYKFRISRKGPKFEHNVSEPTRVFVTFDPKYVLDLSKFLRSFDDNRFVLKTIERGAAVIQLRFPIKQRKETFMEAYQSIILEDVEIERTEAAQALFKTSLYNPVKPRSSILEQQVVSPPKPHSSKISMTNYSGPNFKDIATNFKDPATKPNKVIDDYTQGSLLTWMDNILLKERDHHSINKVAAQSSQTRLQNQQLAHQLSMATHATNQQAKVSAAREELRERKQAEDSNNLLKMAVVLNKLKIENEELSRENSRLSSHQGSHLQSLDVVQRELDKKEAQIVSAYTKLSAAEQGLGMMTRENDRLVSQLRHAEKRADGLLVDVAEMKVRESRLNDRHQQQVVHLEERVSILASKQFEYEHVGEGPQRLSSLQSKEMEEHVQIYRNDIQRLQKELIAKEVENETLKTNPARTEDIEAQELLQVEITRLKSRLDQEQLNFQKVTVQNTAQTNKTKAHLLEVQTLLRQREAEIQSLKHHGNEDSSLHHEIERISHQLKDREVEISNLQAEIEVYRMKDPVPSPRNEVLRHFDSNVEEGDARRLRADYQSMVGMRNMVETRCEQLLVENHELSTLVKKLQFEVQYLQSNRQDPEVEECKRQIDEMNEYIEEKEREFSQLANEFQDFKREATLRDARERRGQESKSRNSDNSLLDSSQFIAGDIEVYRRQNSMLVQENDKLRVVCEKYLSDAKECSKLRSEVIGLRRKMLESEANLNSVERNNESHVESGSRVSYKQQMSEERERVIAVSIMMTERQIG